MDQTLEYESAPIFCDQVFPASVDRANSLKRLSEEVTSETQVNNSPVAVSNADHGRGYIPSEVKV